MGLVEVGKILRAKYPPGHFDGQANPKKTQSEAWQLCEQGVQQCVDEGKQVILIDGQPRDVSQVGLCVYSFPSSEYELIYLLVDAALDERDRRARLSRSGEDLETLAIPRLTNDMISYYPVLVELIKMNLKLRVFDSTNPHRIPVEELFSPLVDDILCTRGKD